MKIMTDNIQGLMAKRKGLQNKIDKLDNTIREANRLVGLPIAIVKI